MNAPTTAVVRLQRSGYKRETLARVTLPGQDEVRVRFRRGDGPVQWKCDACGDHRFSTCDHELAARDAIRQTPPRTPRGAHREGEPT